MLLEGKIEEAIRQIDEEIKVLASKQEYEKAADLRDKKMALIQLAEKQKVSNINENTIDVIGLYKNDISICIEIFFVRNSRMIGREHYFFDTIKGGKTEEILSEFRNMKSQLTIMSNNKRKKILTQLSILCAIFG